MSCFNTAPLGVQTIVVEKIVYRDVPTAPAFDPKFGMSNPMPGTDSGSFYTVIAAFPKGRVGVREIGGQVRVRIVTVPGAVLNKAVLGEGFSNKGGHTSGVFSCEGAVDAIIRANRSLSV